MENELRIYEIIEGDEVLAVVTAASEEDALDMLGGIDGREARDVTEQYS